jgi:LysM repeat protein
MMIVALAVSGSAWGQNYPITDAQRSTAQQVAQSGVALSELAPDAPDSYTVKAGDTLWDISRLFLKSPWRWPELWGMNMEQIRNPHLIYPGQVLGLEKDGGRARLRLANAGGDGSGAANGVVTLRPRMRAEGATGDPIDTLLRSRIETFLNEAVILSANELASAPRIVATQEGRVILSPGDTAFVRGAVVTGSRYRLFREPRPLSDPQTGEVLGFEAAYVGTAVPQPDPLTPASAGGEAAVVATPVVVKSARMEAAVGDRLSATIGAEPIRFAPRAPAGSIDGRVVSVYGESPQAGINQVVVINRGSQDGMEPGHVLAVWQPGKVIVDKTSEDRAAVQIPDTRSGLLIVFRTSDRLSYALVVDAQNPVRRGDRLSQP